MPITKRSEAVKNGFAQVREALTSFKMDVVKAEFGQWGGQLKDDAGNIKPPREFFELEGINVEVLETTEELSMPITDWNFRVNCSNFEGSFWVDKFLASADANKVEIPDGLVGKRVKFTKATQEARDPAYNYTNYVISGVEDIPDSANAPAAPAAAAAPTVAAVAAPEETADEGPDLMAVACALAVGKTEAQFRTSVALEPAFKGSPLLSLAKQGVVTQSLINDGKLVLVDDKYQLPS